MYITSSSILLAAAAVPLISAQEVPSLKVPCCPDKATIQYSKSVPNLTDFPITQVDLCYDNTSIKIDFTAYNETNFYFNATASTNDAIYNFEVMESFIALGTTEPKSYLEFEVAPNNVTFNAFIYNPSKVRADGATFDTLFLQTPREDGVVAETTLDREAEMWVSRVSVPLGLFNVEDGEARGTKWRMNFFRIVVSPETFPDQLLGAWSPPDEASFHKTPFFGHVEFV